LLAHLWAIKSRNRSRPAELVKEIDEQPNAHNQLVYRLQQTSAVVNNREYLVRMVWKKAEEGGYVVVTASEESTRRPANRFVPRATYKSAIKIEKVDNEWTRIVQVIRVNTGGSIPFLIANRWLKSRLAAVTEIQEYFGQMRGLDEYDKADGRALGYRRECAPP
jgi:hypothetical protein